VDGPWITKSEVLGKLSLQLVSKIANLCGRDPPTSRRDGRTDRQTTCNQITQFLTRPYVLVANEAADIASATSETQHAYKPAQRLCVLSTIFTVFSHQN